jgi:hypothetical protein
MLGALTAEITLLPTTSAEAATKSAVTAFELSKYVEVITQTFKYDLEGASLE